MPRVRHVLVVLRLSARFQPERRIATRLFIKVRASNPHLATKGHHMTQSKYSQKDIERFWSKVAVTDSPDDCWLWTRGLATGGYGAFSHNGKNRIASVVAWEITNGEKPAGMVICHQCDNPPCCNPAHLVLGTQSQTLRDCAARGRHHPPGWRWDQENRKNFTIGRKVNVKYKFFPDEVTWVNRSHYGAIGVIDAIELDNWVRAKPYHVIFDFDTKGDWFKANDLQPVE